MHVFSRSSQSNCTGYWFFFYIYGILMEMSMYYHTCIYNTTNCTITHYIGVIYNCLGYDPICSLVRDSTTRMKYTPLQSQTHSPQNAVSECHPRWLCASSLGFLNLPNLLTAVAYAHITPGHVKSPAICGWNKTTD